MIQKEKKELHESIFINFSTAHKVMHSNLLLHSVLHALWKTFKVIPFFGCQKLMPLSPSLCKNPYSTKIPSLDTRGADGRFV